jgi:phosphoribosylformylglycinamidine synthase
VGANPARIAILDNFCWGYTDRPETLGSLVRAALACYDVAVALGTPFISGKDSLNNEFSYEVEGEKKTISIPSSLLISALGQVEDVQHCVTMDLKTPGNVLYQVGVTHAEMGGSHFNLVQDQLGGAPPQVDPALARKTFAALHQAICAGTVRACHDLSEGGLGVAVAEMAFAGGLGADIALDAVPHNVEAETPDEKNVVLLFAESNTRFVCEVSEENCQAFENALGDVPHAKIGKVSIEPKLRIIAGDPLEPLVDADIAELKEAWQAPLRW